MTYKHSSTYLTFLSILILIINLIMIISTYRITNDLKNDANIINELGIIRGSIQRVSKLVISDSLIETDNISDNISHLIKKYKLVELEENWRKLQAGFDDYKKNSTVDTRTKIINQSEECWLIADATVLKAQLNNENKVSRINIFFIFLVINFLTVVTILILIFKYVRRRLEFNTNHDPLTNLLNRRAFDDLVNSEVERFNRYHNPLCLIIIDIDYFKNINDTYGHKVGDIILQELSTLVKSTVRKTDSVFRIGGEEFAVLCPDSGVRTVEVAEKIRQIVEKHTFNSSIKFTISLGVCRYVDCNKKEELFINADNALYHAKESGRNRIEIFSKNLEYNIKNEPEPLQVIDS